MAQEESLDYLIRQQSKVRTPKTLVKVVRAHTRELKRATRREHEKSQVEALSQIAREAIRGGFDIAEKAVQGTFGVGTAIAGNPNPISQAIAIGGGLVFLAWLVLNFPGFARFTHLDSLILTVPELATELAKQNTEAIDEILPDLTIHTGGTGRFCFVLKQGPFPIIPITPPFQLGVEQCFTGAAERDEAVRLVREHLGFFNNFFIVESLPEKT